MVLPEGIELSTSPLPREKSAPEAVMSGCCGASRFLSLVFGGPDGGGINMPRVGFQPFGSPALIHAWWIICFKPNRVLHLKMRSFGPHENSANSFSASKRISGIGATVFVPFDPHKKFTRRAKLMSDQTSRAMALFRASVLATVRIAALLGAAFALSRPRLALAAAMSWVKLLSNNADLGARR
jgi:hypothetical protein